MAKVIATFCQKECLPDSWSLRHLKLEVGGGGFLEGGATALGVSLLWEGTNA